jgi:hypothetical protein
MDKITWEREMRRVRYLVVLVLCLGFVPIQSGIAANKDCGLTRDDVASACRQYRSTDKNGPVLYQFMSFLLPTSAHADAFYTGSVGAGDSSGTIPTNTMYRFGDRQAFFILSSDSLENGMVIFQLDRRVAMWGVGGTDIDAFALLHDLFATMQAKSFSNDASGQVMSLMPGLDDLPSGFALAAEQYLGGVIPVAPTPSSASSSASPDLQATIASLQTQVAQGSSGGAAHYTPTRTPIPTPTPAFAVSGSGTNSTRTFSVSGDWDMAWSYNCSNFGMAGNFIVFIYNANGSMSYSNFGPNQLGLSGTGVEHYHSGGSYYLQVLSTCSWKITVFD